jgi:hypothetical protein
MKHEHLSFFCSLLLVTLLGTTATAWHGHPERHHAPPAANCERKKELLEAHLDEYITEKMEAGNAVGLSVVVVANNRIVYQKGFGYADRENSVPVDSSTVFHIGSVTKVFTGIGIMQLVQSGQIDPDKPVQRYLPELQINYLESTGIPVTIRSMLAHQSGLTESYQKGAEGTEEYPTDYDFRMYAQFSKIESNRHFPRSPRSRPCRNISSVSSPEATALPMRTLSRSMRITIPCICTRHTAIAHRFFTIRTTGCHIMSMAPCYPAYGCPYSGLTIKRYSALNPVMI